MHFVLCNTILECYNPRFLNKTEISIQKYNHNDIVHTLPTVKTEGISTEQTIRAKQSPLSSTRYYSKATLNFIDFVEAFTCTVQIYTFLFKTIQILLCKNKHNTLTLLQLENVYITYSFLYVILDRHHLSIHEV